MACLATWTFLLLNLEDSKECKKVTQEKFEKVEFHMCGPLAKTSAPLKVRNGALQGWLKCGNIESVFFIRKRQES